MSYSSTSPHMTLRASSSGLSSPPLPSSSNQTPRFPLQRCFATEREPRVAAVAGEQRAARLRPTVGARRRGRAAFCCRARQERVAAREEGAAAREVLCRAAPAAVEARTRCVAASLFFPLSCTKSSPAASRCGASLYS
ncbi:hypothetical protein ACP70R_015647 [Stipagrostis hirtigluma subsp. patula]